MSAVLIDAPGQWATPAHPTLHVHLQTALAIVIYPKPEPRTMRLVHPVCKGSVFAQMITQETDGSRYGAGKKLSS